MNLPTSEAEKPITIDQNTIIINAPVTAENVTVHQQQKEGSLHDHQNHTNAPAAEAAHQTTITANAPATVDNDTTTQQQKEILHDHQEPANVSTAEAAVDETVKATSDGQNDRPEPLGPTSLQEGNPAPTGETPQQSRGSGPSALFKQHNLRLSAISANRQGAIEQILKDVGRPVDRKFCPTTFYLLSNLAGATGTYYHTEGAYDAQTANGTCHT